MEYRPDDEESVDLLPAEHHVYGRSCFSESIAFAFEFVPMVNTFYASDKVCLFDVATSCIVSSSPGILTFMECSE